MHSWLAKGILAVVTLLLALSGMAWAQADDNDGCSNATLKGDYGFSVSAQTLNANGTTTFASIVGMTHYDGVGTFTQVDFALFNGVPGPGPTDPTTGFRTGQTGTYTVYPDCTGSAKLDAPYFPAPVQLKFVLTHHGRTIHSVFLGQLGGPVTAWKLGSVRQQEDGEHE